jgi:anaerobic magnesium-protoporphyrin IX monomethyl ester cyclase
VLILVTHANHIYADRKQVRKMQPYPPLQTLIAASILRREGHQVIFFDCTFDRDFRSAIERVRPDLLVVSEDNFNFLTKMCLLANRDLAFEMALFARDRGIPSIVNSSDSSDHAGAYRDAGFECVIQGELEQALVDVTRTCESGQPVPAIVRGGPMHGLDALPSPAWDLVDIAQYREAWISAHGYFSLNLAASRGCPYRCNWCAKPIYGDAYRYYSPDRVAAEMETIKDLFAPDELWFADDIFGLSARWTREFAASVAERNAAIPFRIQSRCDLMTRDTVPWLAAAGCVEVWMGAESGSQKILDAMDKGTRVAQIYEARENLRLHGIRACYFLQFGYLGEDWDDVEATIRMVRETRPDDIGVSVAYPLPNTRFHQIVQSQISAQANWRDSADLAMMFHGAFPSDVYRALADALHLEIRGQSTEREVQGAWEKVEQLRCACC